jgi:hypothetical protein
VVSVIEGSHYALLSKLILRFALVYIPPGRRHVIHHYFGFGAVAAADLLPTGAVTANALLQQLLQEQRVHWQKGSGYIWCLLSLRHAKAQFLSAAATNSSAGLPQQSSKNFNKFLNISLACILMNCIVEGEGT